jgi:DNA-binding response OmpR family regulator
MRRLYAAREEGKEQRMRLLTLSDGAPSSPLPALELLPHTVRRAPLAAAHAARLIDIDAIIIDATSDLGRARAVCLSLRATTSAPVVVVMTEAGLVALTAEWGAAELILVNAGPAEIEARLKLALERARADAPTEVQQGGLSVDEASFTARLHGRTLDLAFKEFELLRFLASHPDRVFTREQILSEVWGTDYYGGTRTVDVHVRRLRAKLGEHESLIGTVRNVGYGFTGLENDDAE